MESIQGRGKGERDDFLHQTDRVRSRELVCCRTGHRRGVPWHRSIHRSGHPGSGPAGERCRAGVRELQPYRESPSHRHEARCDACHYARRDACHEARHQARRDACHHARRDTQRCRSSRTTSGAAPAFVSRSDSKSERPSAACGSPTDSPRTRTSSRVSRDARTRALMHQGASTYFQIQRSISGGSPCRGLS